MPFAWLVQATAEVDDEGDLVQEKPHPSWKGGEISRTICLLEEMDIFWGPQPRMSFVGQYKNSFLNIE